MGVGPKERLAARRGLALRHSPEVYPRVPRGGLVPSGRRERERALSPGPRGAPGSERFEQAQTPHGNGNRYWQAKDISRVIRTADPERHGIELSLLHHVSPIEWDNIVLYGEYVLNRRLVRRSRSWP